MAGRSTKKSAAPSGEGPRFEATVQQGGRDTALARVADLDLDRVPDPRGEVRLLVGTEDLVRLLEMGYEVHLHRLARPEPLPKELLSDDDAVRRWLEERVTGISRAPEDKEAGS
jgi:hypothetical protein